ncbi:hypothetical protein MA16_Dca002294 [Dendrobium catenatum]|uniref:Uncharacterized protein n=1 Tax=Dendrobium catenatum TaxID=906689 RepID=A0A2I0W044_9ASPA|nr:hypothetical protein MA16_Dca002294 [Dendrobium catenatum]
MTSSTRQWWRRATAAMKDKRSVYLSRIAGGGGHRAEIEAAVALKTLLITHGVLLCSSAAPSKGRLPFDFCSPAKITGGKEKKKTA